MKLQAVLAKDVFFILGEGVIVEGKEDQEIAVDLEGQYMEIDGYCILVSKGDYRLIN